MKTENWIDDRNLLPVADAISWLCRYRMEESEFIAIEEGAKRSDETKNNWYTYAFNGEFKIEIAVTIEPGSSNYSIRVQSDKDILQAVNAIIGMAQTYEIRQFT
jgi:hypothetical protein